MLRPSRPRRYVNGPHCHANLQDVFSNADILQTNLNPLKSSMAIASLRHLGESPGLVSSSSSVKSFSPPLLIPLLVDPQWALFVFPSYSLATLFFPRRRWNPMPWRPLAVFCVVTQRTFLAVGFLATARGSAGTPRQHMDGPPSCRGSPRCRPWSRAAPAWPFGALSLSRFSLCGQSHAVRCRTCILRGQEPDEQRCSARQRLAYSWLGPFGLSVPYPNKGGYTVWVTP